jgi:hypothetical protein
MEDVLIMKSPLVASVARPGSDFNSITQLGIKGVNLALKFAAALDARLPPDVVAGLVEDLDSLGIVVPGATQARNEAKTATATQDALAEKGYELIRSVRVLVHKARASKEVQSAYTVGHVIRPRVVNDVLAGLQQIIERATAFPAEAASLGILGKDVAAMVAARDALTGADKVQEQKRASAPLTTKERNTVANRVVAAVAWISGAGTLEFADAPETRALFEALKLTRKSKKAKPVVNAGGAQPPIAPPVG